MKSRVLTITVNPAIDKTVTVPNFEIGRDFREESISLSAGGKGINVSRVLQRLGVSTTASGFLGSHEKNYIRNRLKCEGIKADFSPVTGNTRISLTIIDPKTNTVTRVLERGPHINKSELENFMKKFSRLILRSQYVVFSGRNIPGAPDDLYADLISIAKKRNIITVLDTSGTPYELGLKKKPYMIKPNIKEAEQIIGKRLSSIEKIKQAAKTLQKSGIQIVAITLESRGAIVFDGKEMLHATPPKIKTKSPVGCGDSFIAGFIAGHMQKKSLLECTRLATSCGTANALSINPGFVTKDGVLHIAQKVRVKSIK